MNLKKHLIPNIPYVVIGLFATNLGEGWRLAAGSNASEKLLHIVDGLSAAFANPLPSFHLADLCIGAAVGGFLRLAVHLKGKNAKKYRKNMEYGSARCLAFFHFKEVSHDTEHRNCKKHKTQSGRLVLYENGQHHLCYRRSFQQREQGHLGGEDEAIDA